MTSALAFEVQSRRPKPRINPLAVDIPDIIRWIEQKRPRAIGDWNELGAEEYGRSFTAARTMQADVVSDLYEGLLETMREGGGQSDFADRMLPVLRAKGWLPDLDDEALGRRARLIYDTNLRTSQAVGKWRSFQRTRSLLPYLRYSAVMDRRTRPSHAALHGIIRPVEDAFWNAAFPPCGFQCFLPDVRIKGAVTAGVRRWHSGKVVEVTTVSGRKITTTPDHPILTRRGWVVAEHIGVGEHLLGSGGIVDASLAAVEDDENLPPRAEDLFEAMADHALALGHAPALKLYDQSQGGQGEINVVCVDQELALKLLAQRGGQIVLVGTDLVDGIATGLGERAVADRVADLETAGANDPVHRAPAHLEMAGHSVSSHPGICFGLCDHGGFENIVAPARGFPGPTALPFDSRSILFEGLPLDQFGLGPSANDDALFLELVQQGSAPDAGLFLQLLQTHSGIVAIDEVAEVRNYQFSGHVYDFQTEESIISASGLIVHNCRCVVTALSRSQALRAGGATEAGRVEQALATARALSRGDGDFWGRNVGALADEMAVAQVQRVNERRLPGSAPIGGTFGAGRSIWNALFGLLVSRLVEQLADEDE